MAKYEKRQKRDEIWTAAGVALFVGFWVGSAAYVCIVALYVSWLEKFQIFVNIFEAIETFGAGKSLLLLDLVIAIVTYYFLVRRSFTAHDAELND